MKLLKRPKGEPRKGKWSLLEEKQSIGGCSCSVSGTDRNRAEQSRTEQNRAVD